jgi:hypothetical protein
MSAPEFVVYAGDANRDAVVHRFQQWLYPMLYESKIKGQDRAETRS